MFAVFFLGKELNMLKIYHSKVILIILLSWPVSQTL